MHLLDIRASRIRREQHAVGTQRLPQRSQHTPEFLARDVEQDRVGEHPVKPLPREVERERDAARANFTGANQELQTYSEKQRILALTMLHAQGVGRQLDAARRVDSIIDGQNHLEVTVRASAEEHLDELICFG